MTDSEAAATTWATVSPSTRDGADGVPLPAWDVLPVRLVLPLHCFVAGSVAALAAAWPRVLVDRLPMTPPPSHSP
ncbi:hypothetical protein [Streptomyces vinaceus]|uniref:hypothetical protein n=1 Tax=Streptomyces vinaceus TaxID=1960 RepID=UPI0037F75E06